jgi:hypothetical protein
MTKLNSYRALGLSLWMLGAVAAAQTQTEAEASLHK